jgi:prepilin signal peptidase PulO-like enzyme (type II secretory pathway)
MEAIESERHNARRMVLGEALILLPVLVTAFVLAWYFGRNDSTQALAQRIVHFPATRDWQPIYGLATAATGFIIAGGIGWTVRITTSLLWGRETFGTGDIHMMAAAGCVAGWPVVLIGFVLSSFLALAGWLLTLPLKRTRAIPLGPWLSLSFLIVVLCYDPIMRSQVIRNMIEAYGQWPVIFGNFTVSR